MKSKVVDCSIPGTKEFIIDLAKAKNIPGAHDVNSNQHVGWDGKFMEGYWTLNHVQVTVIPLSEMIKFIEDYIEPLTLAGHPVIMMENMVKVGCNEIPLSEVDSFINEYKKHYNGKK